MLVLVPGDSVLDHGYVVSMCMSWRNVCVVRCVAEKALQVAYRTVKHTGIDPRHGTMCSTNQNKNPLGREKDIQSLRRVTFTGAILSWYL